ncbi:MAG: class I adenylate-forming enzyme family protein [Dehalococcoidia bacterium]
MTVVEMIARNARMYPNDIALIELRPSKKLRREITWKDFDERVSRVANALIKRGVRKGDRVVHWMMNSIDWLEAYFGVIRIGAWAVPLSFRFDSRDLKYCVDIVEARVMILGEEFTERVEAAHAQLPTIEHYIFVGQNTPKDMGNFEDILGKASPKPPVVDIKDDDEAALYFTSGTTGPPKPILLTHKNLESGAIVQAFEHQTRHEDNFLVCPPLYHLAKIHWFGNLIVGARGTLLTEVNPQNMFDAIYRERVTRLFLLVPWAQDILGALDRGELRKEDYDNLSCCRRLHMGAQPVPASLVKRWKEYFPDMLYETDFGLSESTGPGCIRLGYGNEHKIGAIGKAGLNWETRIVNDKDEDVAQGEVGELLVRGNGVMKAYYKNPEKTAEALKGGWLHTGYMARMDNDGFIYLVDRKKDVIISGGENIFPGEIEEVFRGHPKIHDVAMIGVPDERLGEVVAAIIDPGPGMTLTEEEVKQFCQPRLPKYKWPRRIIFDKVPRNPTGKIEKPKLREKYSGKQEAF